jgi:hypothetical protein
MFAVRMLSAAFNSFTLEDDVDNINGRTLGRNVSASQETNNDTLASTLSFG